MCRKMCKDCPWRQEYKKRDGWINLIKIGIKDGEISDRTHKCHNISDDTWATESPITKDNVCIGSIS